MYFTDGAAPDIVTLFPAKFMEQLQADLALLRKAFNERIQYVHHMRHLLPV